MTLYHFAVGLCYAAGAFALVGLVLLLLRQRILLGASLTLIALVVGLTGGGLFNHAQAGMRDELSLIPPTRFYVNTSSGNYVVDLHGADAACLSTHIKTLRAKLHLPDGARLRNGQVIDLRATPAQNLPMRLDPARCNFQPTEITLAAAART